MEMQMLLISPAVLCILNQEEAEDAGQTIKKRGSSLRRGALKTRMFGKFGPFQSLRSTNVS